MGQIKRHGKTTRKKVNCNRAISCYNPPGLVLFYPAEIPWCYSQACEAFQDHPSALALAPTKGKKSISAESSAVLPFQSSHPSLLPPASPPVLQAQSFPPTPKMGLSLTPASPSGAGRSRSLSQEAPNPGHSLAMYPPGAVGQPPKFILKAMFLSTGNLKFCSLMPYSFFFFFS